MYNRLDCSICNGKETRRSYGYEFEDTINPCRFVANIFYLYHCTSCGDNTRVDFKIDGTYTEEHIQTNWTNFKWNTE